MKTLELTNIVQNVRGLGLTKSMLETIIAGYSESIEALLAALNCDPAEITILSGAVVEEDGDDYTVTDGWAAYGGEIFQVDAGAFTAAGALVGVWVIETTYHDDDPLTFDDGNTFDVNAIRKLKLQSGAAASGIKDWDEVVTTPLNNRVFNDGNTSGHTQTKILNIVIGDWNMDSTALVSIAHGLDITKIRSVSVLIRDDASVYLVPLSGIDPNGSAGDEDGFFVNGENLTITRLTSGKFDSSEYNSTGFNRGFITIIHEQ
jgi:hypothetical protein